MPPLGYRLRRFVQRLVGYCAILVMAALAVGVTVMLVQVLRQRSAASAHARPTGRAAQPPTPPHDGNATEGKEEPSPAAPPQPLSRDARVAWEKERRRHPKKAVQLLALTSGPRGSWQAVREGEAAQPLQVGGRVPFDFTDDPPPPGNEETASARFKAERAGREVASRPSVKAVAVVDLYDATDPRVLGWVIDEGQGPRVTKQPPEPALATALTHYLGRLQATAGES
jgi:hypothetical protein